jgi:hypothetical protein
MTTQKQALNFETFTSLDLGDLFPGRTIGTNEWNSLPQDKQDSLDAELQSHGWKRLHFADEAFYVVCFDTSPPADSKEAETEQSPLSLKQMQAILSEYFGKSAELSQVDTEQYLHVNYERACWSAFFQEKPAERLILALRELAGKALASAEAISVAEGLCPEMEMHVLGQAYHQIGVTGLSEEVSILVDNVCSEEEAITKARQAFALLSPDQKPAPHRHRVTRPAGGSGMGLRPSPAAEDRFWLGMEGVFENVDICVWNESSRDKAMAIAEQFVEHLQGQKPDRMRLTA